jgi:Protein of unknown function (DUF3987)
MGDHAYHFADEPETEARAPEWGEPIPLFPEHVAPVPYPDRYLPRVAREMVLACADYGQQPLALLAGSAWSSMSLAAQPLVNVARDKNLVGPISLSMLTVARSGERKTAADKRMARTVRAWEAHRRAELAIPLALARTATEAWAARREGLVNRIKRLSGSTKATDGAEASAAESDLTKLDQQRPKTIIIPELFMEDVTPERLAQQLAEGWPSASLWSDEGGLVVGSHAMSEDTAMRFVALLNRLWDANPFSQKRTTRGDVRIEGRRFTCSLMVQPEVLAVLLAQGGGIARGSGAMARFLMCWPESTMGGRLYRAGDLESESAAAFDRRISRLLEHPLPVAEGSETMELAPPTLPLSAEAFEIWRAFHDAVEIELGATGEYGEVGDFAAKTPEQAARIAACAQVFDHGPQGEIDGWHMEAGCSVSLWHLNEAKRVTTLVGRSGAKLDAKLLLEWLLQQPARPTAGDVLRLGPNPLRDKDRRDKALAILAQHELARTVREQRRVFIEVNPELRPAR